MGNREDYQSYLLGQVSLVLADLNGYVPPLD
jgi:hypothetical protein